LPLQHTIGKVYNEYIRNPLPLRETERSTMSIYIFQYYYFNLM
jgi:hypothetical protein